MTEYAANVRQHLREAAERDPHLPVLVKHVLFASCDIEAPHWAVEFWREARNVAANRLARFDRAPAANDLERVVRGARIRQITNTIRSLNGALEIVGYWDKHGSWPPWAR